ncbi:hypothetical protein F5X68DRAFT_255011 [Plectosphaerella plurivora]|uniref:DUF7136 domain-containing protein n=1 Tax=Plectosphaerella plurivora TaxID=936078 RepID=A0A9P8VF56_9PEZI|nr:hypothetical protein F5X68DRAFT_255011 [Plectosphaerella plurivora]
MRLPALLTIIQPLLLTRVASADRQLPADVQVDLVFPRNETYAPTQYFPIVFDVQNLDAVWPLEVSLEVRVTTPSYYNEDGTTGPSWKKVWTDLSPEKFSNAFNATPNAHFLWIPAVNMTNGTTGQFSASWEITIRHLCYPKELYQPDWGYDRWHNRPHRVFLSEVEFSTAPGAQLPDIAAAANSCSKRDKSNSAAVRITEVRKTDDGHPCPVLEEIKPSSCGQKPVASLLAANVSVAMLGEMGCEEGEWQTIKTPCPKKSAASLPAGFGLGGLIALAFTYWHIL